jgi:nucleotidyltransferase/DNA polymerase involved in DNA repair
VRIDAFAVAALLRAQPGLRDRAVIIGGDAQGHGAVLAASALAGQEGVQPGMTLRAAEKICPHALVLPADPQAIDAAARDVLAVLGRYTPDVEPAWIADLEPRPGAHATHCGGCPGAPPSPAAQARLARCFGATLDVHGCERLFGPPATIATAIGAALAACGYSARIGVAANPSLAAVAAAVAQPIHEGAQPDILCVPVGHEQAFLESIPLTLFETFDSEMIERLHALGIRAAGQLARLPEAAVRRRFGQAGQRAHEEARGVAQRALAVPSAPVTLEAACHLEDPTADGLWLDRELARLAEQLAGKLAARGQSAGLLTLSVTVLPTLARGAPAHSRGVRGTFWAAPVPVPPDTRASWDARAPRNERPPGGADIAPAPLPEARSLHLKQPVAGVPAILARARELLAQLAPRAAVMAMRLEAAALGQAAAQAPLPLIDAKNEKVDAVAQRLRGRFGPRAARRVQLVADAVLPEDCVAWDGPANIPSGWARTIEVRTGDNGQPVALRRDPRPWEALRAICSHWRLRTNWWSTPVHRHYYRVETLQGAVLDIYQEQGGGGWYLAGRRD